MSRITAVDGNKWSALCPPGQGPQYQLVRRQGGLQSRCGRYEEKKILSSSQESNSNS